MVVECQAQECPSFLTGGFLELFVGLPVDNTKLTVVTLTEHTIHDMMEWSPAMAQEREELLHHVRKEVLIGSFVGISPSLNYGSRGA